MEMVNVFHLTLVIALVIGLATNANSQCVMERLHLTPKFVAEMEIALHQIIVVVVLDTLEQNA
jgi:2-phosphoglycerate kinase